MWLFIQPDDTLFFRDGRPFDAGSDVWTGQIFPPYPPTCYGMIRTLLVHQVSGNVAYNDFFRQVPDNFKDLLGDESGLGSLNLRGPYLGRRYSNVAELYVPCPSDLYFQIEDDRSSDRKWCILQPSSDSNLLKEFSNIEHPFMPLAFSGMLDDPQPEPEPCFISGEGLMQYLLGQAENSFLLEGQNEELWKEEPSTIIARDSVTLTAQEHQLAHPDFIRLNPDVGLMIQVDDSLSSLFKDSLTARLGGECRVCSVEALAVENLVNREKMIDRINSTGRFKALLTTPGYFPVNNCFPDFLTDKGAGPGFSQGEWVIAGTGKKVQLKAMACGRALRIAGWDLAKGMPKPMIKAVPAGAVYYFEIDESSSDKDNDWVTKLVDTSFPGTMPGGETEYTKQGFNNIMIGGWDYVS
ncbi:MAG: type III-B CRISPR module-associated protein Cmr3 [Desulfotignum sp.]|nr:type III-B CRISPR module-associated protein Cmr3 [Desulfotignum sp.]